MEGGVEKHFQDGSVELQIPPLRYATVGMTKGRVALPFGFDDVDDEQQVPPLRSPGFPVELGGVGALHAPFSYRKAHTRPCPALRGRKSGYAPVGMTLLLGTAKRTPSFQPPLSMEASPFLFSSRAKPRDLRFNGPFLEMFLGVNTILDEAL
jgi:hypothetical protein